MCVQPLDVAALPLVINSGGASVERLGRGPTRTPLCSDDLQQEMLPICCTMASGIHPCRRHVDHCGVHCA
jgi:hypothetical protein